MQNSVNMQYDPGTGSFKNFRFTLGLISGVAPVMKALEAQIISNWLKIQEDVSIYTLREAM